MNLMKQFKFITLTLIFLSVFSVNAQQKLQKTSQSVKANKDLTLNLDTSYTNIEIDTWNKNEVKIEAYIESKELTKEELQDILDRWDVEVKGSGDNISISTSGGIRDSWNFDFNFEFDDEALKALEELQFVMVDMPEMPEMPEIPEIDFKMPVLPEMPELPELPEGVHNVNFDFDTYKKEGEAYLEKWSKEYEAKYGKEYKDKMKAWAKEFSKTDFDKYSKEMEVWGKKFGESYGKDMEVWGEKFGKEYEAKMEIWSKKMDGKWAKDMEAWGEKFGEKFGKEFEERMEARTQALEKRLEKHEERQLVRVKELEKRAEAREKRSIRLKERLESSRSGKVIKTIKIKMPKDTKLKVNVRHGELKFASVIHNLKADLSHSTLLATRIDGSLTSINASYSPVIVSNWDLGELKLNYVKSAELKIVNQLTLKSNSSNIVVEELIGNAIINGSFGNLEINKIANSFNNLNLVLENSDAYVTLPKTDYNLQIQGTYSTFKRPDKTTSLENSSSNKTIVIDAKYSNVVMQ
jgi:hypothetical protein